ncbi:N-acetylglucosamine-6-phosphate deacetylase [Parashewanella spongiae]|uniref:N-acetylgalactosamine-6-phosphate deacetylase n=1 Tax=Parashewanella spongiae TaxID=342950 RepID=A0A3A6TRA3_9GAMM|nr:N-acetylglucosamine-6-phosphate deacetylase [Parashewanella spongiae]MCL1079462.1 N-acetylglucosamine-6-phosphate deacetylase [Parashewanella spongiae]RJY07630.1 N-acetylglucosamine-6-phosphate deacetylase [Parashewanella spongiae]
MAQQYIARRLFDGERYFENLGFSVEKGVITEFDISVDNTALLLTGTVMPGYIDVQVNGGGGVLFNATPTVDAIKTIAQTHARFGTTSLLPTLVTDDYDTMHCATEAVVEALEQKVNGVVGVHFEGPHLSVTKKGVHCAEHIRTISDKELALFMRKNIGKCVVTLAPENISADIIKELVQADVTVCLGHSNADYDTTLLALDAGAKGFTHLFNAMSPMTSREPGMVGAALYDEHSWCGLIVDGLHVHPLSAQVALKAKPKGKIMLVTDAMPPVGLEDDVSFEFFGQVIVRRGNQLNALTGELAGCVLDMHTAVTNSVEKLQVSIEEANRMASLYPAEFLGLSSTKGRLVKGANADFVVINDRQQLQQTVISGQNVFQSRV